MSATEGQGFEGWFRAKGSQHWLKLCVDRTCEACMHRLLNQTSAECMPTVKV